MNWLLRRPDERSLECTMNSAVQGFQARVRALNHHSPLRPMEKRAAATLRWAVLLLCLGAWCPSQAQNIFYNPNDERFKSLYLEKAMSDYRVQKKEFERQKSLFAKSLISEREFNDSEGRFKSAQITYQQAVLSLAFDQPHISIDKAVKFQSRAGKKMVRLTLRNTTGGLVEGRKVELEDLEGVRTDQIANVYVSLLNDKNSIISQPYEAKIEVMPRNVPVAVEFLLLQDLDNVIVKCVFGDKSEEKGILLQKDEGANHVLMASEQFSQEADLGARAAYDLTLELFSSTANSYKLEVLNLPRQVTHDFLEAQTNARLSQVKFSQDVNTRKLSLVVYLPDRYDSSSFRIDEPISFLAAAIPGDRALDLEGGKAWTPADLDRENIGYVRLELIPRGTGRILVRAANFYQEIKPGEKVQMSLNVYNDGTRRLDNIKVRVDAPFNWVASVSPDLIGVLLPGKEEQVSVTVAPPPDVSVGDYEATIKSESFASNRKVDSEDKKLRLHVAASTNLFGTLALIALLGGLLAGVVIVGLKMSRR